MDKNVYKADLLLLVTAAIWGSTFVAQRTGMDHVGPFTFNAVRFAVGAIVLLPLVLKSNRPRPLSGSIRPTPPKVLVLGVLLAGLALFGGITFQQVGLVHTTAGKAGFITGLYVVIVPLMGLLFGQRPGPGGWVGAALAAIGLYFLSITRDFTMAPGDFLVLIGAFIWAAHVLVLGWMAPKMDCFRLAFAQFALCSVFSLAVCLAVETATMAAILRAGVPILYAGALSVGVAYTLQVVAQKDAPPAHAAIILSLESVFAAVTGRLILGETLTSRAVFGCALMLAGMLAAQLWPRSKAKRKQ